MSQFDYHSFFGPIGPLADLLREKEERAWVAGPAKPPRRHDYVLYLGCNVLRTVHLAETVVDVLRAMDVDFVALGGPAHCCGIIHQGNGDVEVAERLTRSTLNQFAAIRPKAVLMWCPSCHFRMDNVVGKQFDFDIPYEHITEFFARNLPKLRFRRPLARRVALHAHWNTRQQQRDAQATRRILESIPGVTVVDIPAADGWGDHCTSKWLRAVGRPRFGQLADEAFLQAKAAGADALVTVYHSCHRELCQKEKEHGLEIVNYISLVAEAMGLPVYEDRFKRYRNDGDVERILDELSDRAARRGVSPARARAAITAHFSPGK